MDSTFQVVLYPTSSSILSFGIHPDYMKTGEKMGWFLTCPPPLVLMDCKHCIWIKNRKLNWFRRVYLTAESSSRIVLIGHALQDVEIKRLQS